MILTLCWLLGCGDPAAPVTEAPVAPVDLTGTTCAACGMVVGEQPPPRGQARHRDGTHAHLCSLGDLRAWAAAPSPHGKLVATWVEQLPPGYDPASPSTAPLPWLEAAAAHFVVGFERPGTMGTPALSFAEPAAAAEAAARLGGFVVGWDTLLTTPHHAVPARP